MSGWLTEAWSRTPRPRAWSERSSGCCCLPHQTGCCHRNWPSRASRGNGLTNAVFTSDPLSPLFQVLLLEWSWRRGGIRTLSHPLDSVTYTFHIPGNATNTSDAVALCPPLPARMRSCCPVANPMPRMPTQTVFHAAPGSLVEECAVLCSPRRERGRQHVHEFDAA